MSEGTWLEGIAPTLVDRAGDPVEVIVSIENHVVALGEITVTLTNDLGAEMVDMHVETYQDRS